MSRARDLADSADKDIAGTLTLDGLTVDGDATLQNILNIGGTDPQIRTDTSDGSDNKTLWMGGGGIAYSWDRGGFFYAQGNEAGGHVGITAGNVSGGSVKFTTGGSEAMRIDSSGRVMIGNTAAANMYGSWDDLVVGSGSGDNGITIYAGNTNAATIAFADGTTGSEQYSGYMQYLHNVDALSLGTSGAERMRISSTGKIGINNTSPVEDLHIKGTNPRINVEGDGSSYYPSIRVTGLNGGISFGTYYGGNISGENGIAFLTGSSATDGGTLRMKLDSSGNFLLGKTSVSWTLDGTQVENGGETLGVTSSLTGNNFFARKNNATGTMFAFWYNSTNIGNITSGTSSVSYNTSSDYRLKENVTDVTDGITRIKQLAPKRFNFIADPDTTVDGFIAHEVQDVIPEAISGNKDAMRDEEYEVTPAVLDEDGNVVTEAVMGTRSVPDYQGIDQSKLVPLLTAALQEAITKIETLETKVAALEGA